MKDRHDEVLSTCLVLTAKPLYVPAGQCEAAREDWIFRMMVQQPNISSFSISGLPCLVSRFRDSSEWFSHVVLKKKYSIYICNS